jgi:hypothetical protein
MGFAVPSLLPKTRCALTAPFHPYPAMPSPISRGGLLSVALSLGSPPPEVIRHRASLEPGLSSPPYTQLEAKRPSGLLTTVIRGLTEVPSSSRALDYQAFPRRWLPARNGILIASLAPVPIPYLHGPAAPGSPSSGLSEPSRSSGAVGANWCVANVQSRFDLALACDVSRSHGAR